MTRRTKLWVALLVVTLMVATMIVAACDKTATATFVGGTGATGTAPDPITANIGEDITLPANTFTKANHTFKGWSDGSKTYAAGASYKLEGDVEFTAQWQANADETPRTYFLAGTGAGSIGSEHWDYTETLKFTDVGNNTYKLNNFELVAGDQMKLRFNTTDWNNGGTQYSFGASAFPSDIFEGTDNAVVKTGKDGVYNITLVVSGSYSATTGAAASQITSFTFTLVESDPTYTFTYSLGEYAAAGQEAPKGGEYKEGDEIELAPAPTPVEGYKFTGWSDNNQTLQPGEKYEMPAKNVIMTAQWTRITYTVTFMSQGEVFDTAKVEINQTASAPATNPEHDTATFRYWTILDGEEYVEYDFDTPVTGDITLDAKFAIYIDFNINGATGTAPEGMWGANSISYTATLPTGEGLSKGDYVFGGWANGSTTYQGGQQVLFRASATLTAVWKDAETQYTLTYYSNYSSELVGETPQPEQHKQGDSITLTAPWTREFYVFSGWRAQHQVGGSWVNISNTVLQVGTQYTMPAEDIRLIAVWTGVEVTVVYHANNTANVDADTSTTTLTYENNCNFITNPFKPEEGKQFAGWSYTLDGETLGSYKAKSSYSPYIVHTGDTYTLNLYAIWEDAPVLYEISDYEGVWTNGSSSVIISAVGADEQSSAVGSIIIDNQFVLLGQADGGFVGTNSLDQRVLIVVTSDGITVSLATYNDRQDDYVTNSSVNYATSSKSDIDPDVAIADIAKTWQRTGLATEITISEDGSATISLSAATNVKLYIVGNYVIVTYEVRISIYTFDYQYVLSKSGNQLVGYYVESEKNPVETTFEEKTTTTDPGTGDGGDDDKPTVAKPTLQDGESLFEGNCELTVGSGTKFNLVYIVLDLSAISTVDKQTIRFICLLSNGETSEFPVSVSSSGTSYWEGTGSDSDLGYFICSVNGYYLKMVVWSDEIWIVTDDYDASKVANGEFTLVEDSNSGTGDGEQQQPSELTFTGNATYVKSSTNTIVVTEMTLIVTEKATTIHVKYSVNGVECDQNITPSVSTSLNWYDGGKESVQFYYDITLNNGKGVIQAFGLAVHLIDGVYSVKLCIEDSIASIDNPELTVK